MELKLNLNPEQQNKAINAGIFLLACFIAFKIFQGQQQELAKLNVQRESELNKSMTITSINGLAKRTSSYKKIVNDKDVSALINTINSLVSDSEVKISSLKPLPEAATTLSTEYPFQLTATAVNFDALGKIMSRLENSPQIFVIRSVIVSSITKSPGEKDGVGLDLKLSTFILK